MKNYVLRSPQTHRRLPPLLDRWQWGGSPGGVGTMTPLEESSERPYHHPKTCKKRISFQLETLFHNIRVLLTINFFLYKIKTKKRVVIIVYQYTYITKDTSDIKKNFGNENDYLEFNRQDNLYVTCFYLDMQQRLNPNVKIHWKIPFLSLSFNNLPL